MISKIAKLLIEEEIKAPPVDLQKETRKAFGRNAILGGDLGLGLALPSQKQKDVFVVLPNSKSFDNAINKFKEKHSNFIESPYNEGRLTRKVFSSVEDGNPTSIAFMYGPNADAYKASYLDAMQKITDRKRASILANKQQIEDSLFGSEYQAKQLKQDIDKQLGIRYTV